MKISNYLFGLFIVSLPVLASAQNKKEMVIIKGSLKGNLKGYNRIYMYTRTSNDSAEINSNGDYTFSFPFKEVGMKMLYPQYIKESHMMYQPFGILISGPGVYQVSSDIAKGMHASELKGPEPMVIYHQYENDEKKANAKVYPAMSELYGEKWWQADEKDPRHEQTQKSLDSLKVVYVFPLLKDLAKTHPDSYATAYVLAGSGREIGSLENKEELYNLLSPKMKNSSAGKKFGDYIQGLKNSSVGRKVADFILPDPTGKNVVFSSLKGKYILIDFWASWCVPCRRSFPHMREIYEKYRNSNFEIYSISIDEDKAAWLKAVEEEKNPWLQSLDTKSISQKGFAVTGVPSTFLIDTDGTIIAKEVGFDPNGNSMIEKKLKELFESKATTSKPSVPMLKLN